jgi:hypothetical protein
MKVLIRLKILVFTAFLSACSTTGFVGFDGFELFKEATRNKLAASPNTFKTNPLDSLTRAQLKAFSGPLIFAHLEVSNAYASLSAVGQNGGATTYMTGDDVSLTFRDGILIASRGLGGDLLSSDVSSLPPALKQQETRKHKRVHRYLDAEDHILTMSFDCLVEQSGIAVVQFVERSYHTKAFKERCTGGTITFDNTYWVGVSDNKIVSSRQWVSGPIGYVDLWVLID